jgi:hypothetical protein
VDFDNGLNTAIARLREALSDSAEHPRFIETLPKRGYRFIASLSEAVRRPRARLLVLPFANLSGDPAQEYFSDAMTDEIITELVGLAPEHLAVIARTTAMHYKGSQKDVAEISRELGVDYVVEGSVHRDRLCRKDFRSFPGRHRADLGRQAATTHLHRRRSEVGGRDVLGQDGKPSRPGTNRRRPLLEELAGRVPLQCRHGRTGSCADECRRTTKGHSPHLR